MGRGLKIVLAISLLLNVFFIGAGISAAVFSDRLVHHWLKPNPTPLNLAARALQPDVRKNLRQTMRAEAMDARPDFQAAYQARLKAAELAAQPSFDRSAVRFELDRAREADTRAHMRLENRLLDFMQTLPLDQRAKLAEALKGRPPKQRPSPVKAGT